MSKAPRTAKKPLRTRKPVRVRKTVDDKSKKRLARLNTLMAEYATANTKMNDAASVVRQLKERIQDLMNLLKLDKNTHSTKLGKVVAEFVREWETSYIDPKKLRKFTKNLDQLFAMATFTQKAVVDTLGASIRDKCLTTATEKGESFSIRIDRPKKERV